MVSLFNSSRDFQVRTKKSREHFPGLVAATTTTKYPLQLELLSHTHYPLVMGSGKMKTSETFLLPVPNGGIYPWDSCAYIPWIPVIPGIPLFLPRRFILQIPSRERVHIPCRLAGTFESMIFRLSPDGI